MWLVVPPRAPPANGRAQNTMERAFIVELPESSENTVSWLITDLFSKQMHFIPCQKISPLVL